ncbi:MAG: hypothetical protein FJW14_18885 [Acidimicrobiia bacterium]|nr:hypothetical protein [Acidimicrobiia bacterium]
MTGSAPAPQKETKQPQFPEGWNEERVRRVLEHYENQSDEEAVDIPVELVPQVRTLLARKRLG